MSKFITIVSGLPRSGTSMMMKMLEAGGMNVLIDNARKADEDNPLGYYEFERVKKTKENPSWLEHAEGRVVKMVSMLLYDLPAGRKYRVIFMKRRMTEVLSSQRRMLERTGRLCGDNDDEEMGKLFARHLAEINEWICRRADIEVLYVDYNELMENASVSIERVKEFVGQELNVAGMMGVIDRSLYRQRA